LGNLLRARILGQDDAISELTKRIWQEAICRPGTEPLRLMLAGPVGTGKSVAAKCVAQVLGWPYHYIDAASFDSEHAVMTSLAGASPGIVNSYNDGVLAKISRRPSVVEVADLDHAQPSVRGALCEFFLRALQEGTLQTGSGMIVRTLPSVIFIFTSNVAYGTRKASSSFGFGQLSRCDIRQRVVTNTLEYLGHAFVSRVGEPILFDEFTRQAALKLVEMEIQSLVGRMTGATMVLISPDVTQQILDSLLTLEAGARGVIDATRSALADALRGCADMAPEQVEVRLTGKAIVIVPACDAFRGESLIPADEQDQQDQTAAQSS
jgi:ATP-dependent Clp protease ATP-binding subunit ClpA